METVLKKSVKSAADFNTSLMRELRQERRAYFDLQTFVSVSLIQLYVKDMKTLYFQ